MADNKQRIKLLLVYKILTEQTDEEHPLTTYELIEQLATFGIHCDRRTLSRDMQLFNQYGLEIMSRYVGHKLGYYIADRAFNVSELSVLCCAVQAAPFLTPDKTKNLVHKIADLGGIDRSTVLQNQDLFFSVHKHTNETIFTTISQLQEAICRGNTCSIRAFHFNADGSKSYRHHGNLYSVEPLRLMFKDDNFYVMCYDKKLGVIPRRVDRIDKVEIKPRSKLSEAALIHKVETERYANRVTHMFSGKTEQIELEFHNRLTDQIVDKFGEQCSLSPSAKLNHSILRAEVEISPTFWGWIFTFGNQMRITSPSWVVDEARTTLQTALSCYAE